MLSDTDMAELLEHENIYRADEWAEKQKRIAALNRLTKQQQMLLYTEVTGFITRYLELSAAFDTIEAVINELDYHQSAIARKDAAAFPPAAYV
jgi:adenosyl cobinamide kinase/adenosyl cobinamide phosphate guanylyltransferase